jgi:hypothetical protein
MIVDNRDDEKRNFTILRGQGTFNTIAWTMANPSVVISYLAISLDVPIIIAGLLVTFRQAACLVTALFGTPIAAQRAHKKVDLAATDMVVALCFVLALTAAAFGTSLIVTLAFIVAIVIIGLAGEYQSILNADFYGDILKSDSRNRLLYSVMTLGGAGTAALVLLSHRYFLDSPPFTRHAAVISIGILSFVTASGVVMLVREYSVAEKAQNTVSPRKTRFSFPQHIREIYGNFSLLIHMNWFRRYLVVRIALLTVEMSIPFYAILAALSHHGTPRGLTALVVSTALALCVAGPLWRAVGHLSTRNVMIAGALMAAAAGVLLFSNHFLPVIGSPYVHAVALFIVTIAVNGVSTARSLYYIDVAPKQYRVIGIGVSKVVVRIVGVGLSSILAAVAHLQHVVWAILIVALINTIAALLAFRISDFSHANSDTGSEDGEAKSAASNVSADVASGKIEHNSRE